MRGVIMETKNGRAVLLTKSGSFVNIKDKGYSIGDKVNITSNTGFLCAMAASLVIVCAGIGSYFVPAGYVSVDINPSLMMTLNPYNRVIDVQTFNDDARVLLSKTDIKGKGAEESVEMLINASEEIGYINENNRDVILEVVPGMIKPNMERIQHHNIEITNEMADRETMHMARNIGISMAKVKAIEEYTEKNGGDIRSNAVKFNDKSAKEMRAIIRNDKGSMIYEKPVQDPVPQERKFPNIQEPQSNYKISDNSFPMDEPKRNVIIPPVNQFPPRENAGGGNLQDIPPELNEPPNMDRIPLKPEFPIEPVHQENIPIQDNHIHRDKPQNVQDKPPADGNLIHINQEPQDKQSKTDNLNESAKPGEPLHVDNEQPDKTQQTAEPKPQDDDGRRDSIKEQDGDKPQDSEPKRENSVPQEPQSRPQENTPEKNVNAPKTDVPPNEPKNEYTPPRGEPQNDGGNHSPNEDMGGHSAHNEIQ